MHVRLLRRRGCTRSLAVAPYMRGWRSYFGFCETPEVLIGLTRWVRLRLRAALWRQWKTPRRRRAALLQLGVRPRLASNTAGIQTRIIKGTLRLQKRRQVGAD